MDNDSGRERVKRTLLGQPDVGVKSRTPLYERMYEFGSRPGHKNDQVSGVKIRDLHSRVARGCTVPAQTFRAGGNGRGLWSCPNGDALDDGVRTSACAL